MGLPRFKRRIGWVYQGLREGQDGFIKVEEKDRMGLPKFKRWIGWVYQGLREGQDWFTKV